MYLPISDYALIGNCRSAALVSAAGSIDWLCLPHFDSPAVFLRLLDDQRGGFCAVRAKGQVRSTRGYEPGTNILETELHAESGVLRITDFMPVAEADGHHETDLIRLLGCTSGEVEFTVEVRPTFDFAQHEAELAATSGWSARASGPHDTLHVWLEGQRLQLQPGSLSAQVRLRAGESCALGLARTPRAHELAPRTFVDAQEALARTRAFWERWADTFSYEGEYHELVLRSALALKLMTFRPSGAIVAAPTTSLPEAIGGERNWDYRFTWLRDSTFTLIALMNLGYFNEARQFLHFLRRTVDPSRKMQVLYTVHGREGDRERDLNFLDGYRGSRPVRVGNAAVEQKQLDIFGELLHCIYVYIAHPETSVSAASFRDEFWPVVRPVADYVCDHWREPDQGIWEMRGEPRQHVYSKGSCWLALDRAIRLARHFQIGHDLEAWQREKNALRASFLREGYNAEVGAFVQAYGSRELDAAVLRLPLMGVIKATDPRMRSSIAQIERQLMDHGLVYRYRAEDGLRGQEGAFDACGFWLVDNYVLQGRLEEAEALFRRQLETANDVGLLAEETNPASRAQLGNFPQAFTHIALINCAVRLSAARTGKKTASHAVAEETTELPRVA